MKFTDKQLADFAAYVRVQYEGLYNMFSREARYATGLDEDEYRFVMRNYGELQDEANKLNGESR